MKLKKVLGNILMVLGSIVMLIGLLAFILPKINNRQLQLVLSSFQTPSSNLLIQWMNNGMNFAMEHCFLMLLIGSVIAMLGVLLIISARTDEEMAVSTRKQKASAANTAYMRPVPQPPAATAQPVPHSMEENPFTRYAKRDELPKSTSAPSKAQPEKPQAQQPDDYQDDILTIWDQLQQQPEDADALQIHPVRVENDQAYRRPTDEAEEPAATMPDLPTVDLPLQPAQPEEEPLSEPVDLPEEPVPAVPVAEPVFHTAAPSSEPGVPKARPVIRSTFPTAAREQPKPAPKAPVEEPVSIEADVAAPLQPASRIKSTMGRKR